MLDTMDTHRESVDLVDTPGTTLDIPTTKESIRHTTEWEVDTIATVDTRHRSNPIHMVE